MPAIKVCGRRLHISTDDFFFPGIFSVFMRLIWMILMVVVIVFFSMKKDSCENKGNILTVYLYGALSLTGVVGLLDLVIAVISARGTILTPQPRQSIPSLLVLRAILFVPELGWLLLGTVWAFQKKLHGSCPARDLTPVRVAIVSAWVVYIVLGILAAILFDWLGTSKARPKGQHHSDDGTSNTSTEVREQSWHRTCSVLCCTPCRCDEKKNPDYHSTILEVSKLFALFFSFSSNKENAPVPTDVGAGMVLVSELQNKEIATPAESGGDGMLPSTTCGSATDNSITEYGACTAWRVSGVNGTLEYPPTNLGELSLNNAANREAYENVVHFMKFAMGPYGWPLFIFENLITGSCKLIPDCRCCICLQSREPEVIGDCPMSHCNTAAAINWAGISYDDIIFATYDDSTLMHLPFFIGIDDSHRSVVVSIRGTMSLKDALTDLRAEPRPFDSFPIEGHPSFTAHDGILTSAEHLKRTIDANQLLERAFEKVQRKSPNAAYDLVFVGHSLGAGACTLLATMYRAQYPNLRCFAYSPPGGLIDESCMRYTQEYTVSVVLGDDIVPRMSVQSVESLRMEITDAVTASPHCKPRIFTYALCSLCCPSWCCLNHLHVQASSDCTDGEAQLLRNAESRNTNQERPLLERQVFNIPPRSHHTIVQPDGAAASRPANTREGRRSELAAFSLYPPGRIIHISPMQEACCCRQAHLSLNWISYNSLQRVRVSRNMLSNHLPNHVKAALDTSYTSSW